MWCCVVWCMCVCVYRKIANAQFDPAKLPNTVYETIEKKKLRKTNCAKPNRKGNK